MKRTNALAQRLSQLLARLNLGERVDIYQFAEEFEVSVRILQRDIERLDFLAWEEKGTRFYKVDQRKLGLLTEQDIQRFARFASVSDLFPNIDRQFYQENLMQSIQIKGLQYEDIKHKQKEFTQLNNAIQQRVLISFKYQKIANQETKFYTLAPYCLVNKNGVWYLIGTEQGKQKTFCFSAIQSLAVSNEPFEPNELLLEEIKQNDSISFGNQLAEIIIQVSAYAAPYFKRRNLLPNQALLHQLEDGGLLLTCKNINEMDVIPIVKYWIPHLSIISPSELQTKLIESLREYISN